MSDLYQRRKQRPTALPGGIPRAYFRWKGRISRQQFDAVPPHTLRGPSCPHCYDHRRYQVGDVFTAALDLALFVITFLRCAAKLRAQRDDRKRTCR